MTKVKIFVTESGNTLNSKETFLKRLDLPENKIAREVGACDAILGFCPVISRVGTDIEAALKEIRGLDGSEPPKFIILVVLHHTYDKSHVVPESNKYATDRVYIVNCLLHEDRGFLNDCDLNDNAIKQTIKNLKEIKGRIKEETKANRRKGNPKQNMVRKRSVLQAPVSPKPDTKKGGIPAISGMRIVGNRGERKSSTGNTILGREDGQMTELMEKTEDMVAGKSGCHYEISWEVSKDTPPLMPLNDSGYCSLASKSEDGIKSEPSSAIALEQKMTEGFLTRVPLVNKQAIKVDYEHLIGGGAFGKVYLGSFQGSPAAIKMMPVEMNPRDSLEAFIPLRLSHPHIVRMMAVSRMEKQIALAYEYIHGANLHEILWDKQCSIKLGEQEKMCVALEIAMAVEYTHGRNVIHQDIKPANILISQRTKTAYLTDWGLANMRDSLAQFGAVAGQLCGPHGVGTEIYTAPELFLYNQHCSTMSDMWSLGITFLEMFTNCVPWKLNNRAALTGVMTRQEPPHALAKLQKPYHDIVKPLVKYDPKLRVDAEHLVAYFKSQVDLVKIYGYKW